jgi:hypothetical protein
MRTYIAALGLIVLSACGGGGDVTNPPEQQQFTLTVSGQGSGSGQVSTSAGLTPAINCTLTANAQATGTCSGLYTEGAVVPLTVVPDGSSRFDGWAGDAANCSTSPSCSITMTRNATAVAQLSAAPTLQITSSAYDIDPNFGTYGAVIWVVEVRNPTSQWVESAIVNFTSHDASGTVLTSDFTFVGPIPPGETRAGKSFADFLGSEATVDIQLGEVRFGTPDSRFGTLQVVSSNWRADPNSGLEGAVIWTVEVQNNGSTQVEDVRVDIVIYDSAGKIVTTDFTFVGPIPPGEKRSSESFADYHGTEASVQFQIGEVS